MKCTTNSTVHAGSLRFVADVAEKFGLPTPTVADMVEVVGPYHMTTGDGFLIHDPAKGEWSFGEQMQLTPCDLLHDDNFEVWHMMEELEELERPPLPSDRSKKAMEPPFVHQGQKFAWAFYPKLKRWELAPLGRA